MLEHVLLKSMARRGVNVLVHEQASLLAGKARFNLSDLALWSSWISWISTAPELITGALFFFAPQPANERNVHDIQVVSLLRLRFVKVQLQASVRSNPLVKDFPLGSGHVDGKLLAELLCQIDD